MSKDENIILGYSGHAYVVIDSAVRAGLSIDYYADKNETSKNFFDLKYIGYEQDPKFEGWGKGYGFILGIGDNSIRNRLADLVKKRGEKLLTVSHPSAMISKKAKIGKGVFISAQATVNPFSVIGDSAILNTNSVVEHECLIGQGTHIAPGAIVAGNVKIGKGCFIGANAVIKEGIEVGDNVIVGAGATIIRDISSGKKVVGNPGREI